MLDEILCIDDDAITLMLCKMVVTKNSFSNKIKTATNGEEALNYFKTLMIPLVKIFLTDLKNKMSNLKIF